MESQLASGASIPTMRRIAGRAQNLADLTWWPEPASGDRTVAGAIHPMLPALNDGRAPMFIEYEGFPFASTELLQTKLDDPDAVPRQYEPFYQYGSAKPSGFAPVPRLAYGREFQSFAFVISNAGTLPLLNQAYAARPWTPKEVLDPPIKSKPQELIATGAYRRRTAIGQAAQVTKAAQLHTNRIGAPIDGVTPLASDYPRIGLFATARSDGARDLFREADGRGCMTISPGHTNRWSLADIQWSGNAKRLSLRFFDGPAADPGALGVADFAFEQASRDGTQPDNAVDLAGVDAIAVIATANTSQPANVELTVVCRDLTVSRTCAVRSGALWLRLVLEAGDSAGMTLADTGNHKADGVDAPLLLLVPPGEQWKKGLSQEHTATVHSPRVGYLDFERWLANSDLRKRAFENDDVLAQRLERALLDGYAMRHLDKGLAAALDRLPDPAVEEMRVELIVVDRLGGGPVPALKRDDQAERPFEESSREAPGIG